MMSNGPIAPMAGVPLKKLKVIPTGIHLQKFQNPDQNKIAQLKEEFNLQNRSEKIILFVGMLTARKGVEKVLQISQKLLKEGLNLNGRISITREKYCN